MGLKNDLNLNYRGAKEMGNEIVIPTNIIKKFLKNKTEYDISKKAIIEVKKLVEAYIEDIVEKAIIKMDEENAIREKENLPKKKRLYIYQCKKLSQNHYNLLVNFLIGERGKLTCTRLSKANEEVV